jgi:hypothetical protein
MKSADVLGRVRKLRPNEARTNHAEAFSLPSSAMLDRILLTEPDRRPASSFRVPLSIGVLLAGAGGITFAFLPTPSSANAIVAKAATASAKLGSGRATMLVKSTLDGAANDGTVQLGWSGLDESYAFDYPQSSGSFETRVVGDRVVQRLGGNPWKSIGKRTLQLPESGGLAGVAGGFELLTEKLTFESLGNDGDLQHFRANGDLSPLDTSTGGFVFGTNGAPEARTTALEIWIDSEGLIAKVRTAFAGKPDGHSIEAEATTMLRDLGEPIRIEDPLPR